MHREAYQFVVGVKRQHPEFFTGKKVLEVGSLDINGSVRPFFENCDYIGIDLDEGNGVDLVSVCHAYQRSQRFDVAISTETFEHDECWQKSLKQMYENLKEGGILIITCAAPNRPEHGTTRTGSAEASPFTPDYYRNISIEDFASILPANLFSKSYLGYRGNMDDLYFVGIKKAPINLLDLGAGGDLIEPHGGAMGTTAVDGNSVTVNVIGVNEKPRGAKFARVDNKRVPIFDDIDAADDDLAVSMQGEMRQRKLTVTAEISTKDRYHFLPLTISAILNQTHKPDRLVIYDDGEQKDLRTFSPFDGLLRLADHLGIKWEFFSTPREGQVRNHQHALSNCQTDVIFRCDDDVILEPNVFEECLRIMEDEKVGAVAPLVHHPGGVSPLPNHVTGKLSDVSLGLNIQWFNFNSGPREVEHLYSSFAVRVKALKEAGGYPMNLSVVGHHEESIATHCMYRAGWKLIVNPAAKAYHLRELTGGIRSFSDTSLWGHDEQIWQQYLKTWGVAQREAKLHILDCGTGDALCYRGVFLEYIRRKHPDTHYTLAVCQPEVYEGLDNVTIISIADAKLLVGDRYEDYSLFAWCWKNDWKGSIVDAMKEFYGK